MEQYLIYGGISQFRLLHPTIDLEVKRFAVHLSGNRFPCFLDIIRTFETFLSWELLKPWIDIYWWFLVPFMNVAYLLEASQPTCWNLMRVGRRPVICCAQSGPKKSWAVFYCCRNMWRSKFMVVSSAWTKSPMYSGFIVNKVGYKLHHIWNTFSFSFIWNYILPFNQEILDLNRASCPSSWTWCKMLDAADWIFAIIVLCDHIGLAWKFSAGEPCPILLLWLRAGLLERKS